MSEDERAYIISDSRKFEASLYPTDEALECVEPDPVDIIDQGLMDWEDWLIDATYMAEDWDSGHREFDFDEFSDAIFCFAFENLKTRDFEKRFLAKFEIDGNERSLPAVDEARWAEFIGDLCVRRLDSTREAWSTFLESQKKRLLANPERGEKYSASGEDLNDFRKAMFKSLKSSDLKAIFDADVSYDLLNDDIRIMCDKKRIKEKMEEFL